VLRRPGPALSRPGGGLPGAAGPASAAPVSRRLATVSPGFRSPRAARGRVVQLELLANEPGRQPPRPPPRQRRPGPAPASSSGLPPRRPGPHGWTLAVPGEVPGVTGAKLPAGPLPNGQNRPPARSRPKGRPARLSPPHGPRPNNQVLPRQPNSRTCLSPGRPGCSPRVHVGPPRVPGPGASLCAAGRPGATTPGPGLSPGRFCTSSVPTPDGPPPRPRWSRPAPRSALAAPGRGAVPAIASQREPAFPRGQPRPGSRSAGPRGRPPVRRTRRLPFRLATTAPGRPTAPLCHHRPADTPLPRMAGSGGAASTDAAGWPARTCVLDET